jgi:type I pantothenate kinase
MAPSDVPPAFSVFSRREWAGLRADQCLRLTEDELEELRGLNEPMTQGEIEEIYLPLSRLLGLHVTARRDLKDVRDAFLGRRGARRPYVIGLAGSVASGKSTLARTLRALVAGWPGEPHVEIVTTDGFLHPTRVLKERGLMARKGFPESYDLRRMIRFLADLKAGAPEIAVPVYSHRTYDVLPDEAQVVRQPDVLIFEGLNVLGLTTNAPVVASDFFDFSIYLDAEPDDLERWFVARRLILQATAFRDPTSYFHDQKDMPEDEARRVAADIWRGINLANLEENILPTRQRADLVLRKRADHGIGEVWLRR